jgi:hypothetical protein
MLCVFVFGALEAQGASAANTTAYICEDNIDVLKGAHCLKTGSGSPHGHLGFSESAGNTEVTGTNANTASETTAARPSILKETIAGTELELSATTVSATGTLINRESGGEFWTEESGTITYSGVTVSKPAGKGCKVFTDVTATKTKGTEGVIDANVKATTKGQEDFVKFEPAAGTAFATFFVECTTKVEALEGTWEITGSVKCPTSGATVICSHTETTTQNTLKGKGSKAGLDAAVTRRRAPDGKPVSDTTK